MGVDGTLVVRIWHLDLYLLTLPFSSSPSGDGFLLREGTSTERGRGLA